MNNGWNAPSVTIMVISNRAINNHLRDRGLPCPALNILLSARIIPPPTSEASRVGHREIIKQTNRLGGVSTKMLNAIIDTLLYQGRYIG